MGPLTWSISQGKASTRQRLIVGADPTEHAPSSITRAGPARLMGAM
ncbi:hypothetical protein CGMCC3_g3555 [Colletotrichum fructicola]|nr:uncharacterized protein CGMCC3_g3555 [Colletotrichum fructicola]KAE9580603.1 hypothetical protein CGMCC3_g3555 [Colletotrichum fructicola]